jgi:hypothetical protein
MKRAVLLSCVLLLAFLLMGCGSTPQVVDDNEDTTRLAPSIDLSIQDWLGQSRAELAGLVKERLEVVTQQQDYARANPDSVDLLPGLRPAISLPVFQASKWSDKAAISLPPYLTAGTRDREVALHLSRHGDYEAGNRFADPADTDLKKRIESLRGSRNYPLEWTQLVALYQIGAEIKLASGDLESASTLVHIHKQLQQTLDSKMASGSLGAALLSRGRYALEKTVPALRDPKVHKNRLADDIQGALKDWGTTPTPAPAVELGAPRAEVARIFRGLDKGHVVAAVNRDSSQRVTDLLAMPLDHEQLDGVVAFFNKDDRLSELFVYYFNAVAQNHPEPINLARPLADSGIAGAPIVKQKGILQQTFVAGKLSFQVNIIQAATAGSTPAGAIVRIGDASGAFAASYLPEKPRGFGALHLDRSFEQNRIVLDPTAPVGSVVVVSMPGAVARVPQPVDKPQPVSVVLTKEQDFDLLASFGWRWANEENKHAIEHLLVPLWAAYGGARMEGVDDDRGGYLGFTWENADTTYTLRLPYVDVQPPELSVGDRRGAAGLNARLAATKGFDSDQRNARFAANKLHERLPRWLYLNQVQLGMSRAQALAALPKRDVLHVTETPDGLNVLVLADPPKEATYWAKHMFVRFTPGADGHVAEIRVRYQEGPAAPSAGNPGLFDQLRKSPNGEPETQASSWAEIWSDLPAKKLKPVLYRWLDDRTCLTYQRDSGGSEVAVRDCPLEYPLGQTLPPLLFCSRGLSGVTLGEDRSEVLKRWKVSKPQAGEDGSIDLGPGSKDSPYDAVAVWFENDKVSRIVARHRAAAGLTKDEVLPALQTYWNDNVDQLGIVRRVDTLGTDSAVTKRLASWGWHDDRTRVRCFGMDTEGGARLFTEWREWPVPGKPS